MTEARIPRNSNDFHDLRKTSYIPMKMRLLEFSRRLPEVPENARPAKIELSCRRDAYFAEATKCYIEAL